MTVFRREITKLFGAERISAMGALTSPKTYTALALFQAADAAACAAQVAAAVGLLSARWFPGLARLTTAMLTLYFTLNTA